MQKEEREIKKYLPLAIIIILVVLSFFIIKDYILPLISAFILAYLVKPVYDRLKIRLPKFLSALLCVLIILLIVSIPLIGLVGGIIKQTTNTLESVSLKQYLARASNMEIVKNLSIDINKILDKAFDLLIKLLTDITLSIPIRLISLLITLFAVYYILVDWDKLTGRVIKYLPSKNKEHLSKEIALITHKLVYGTLLISLIEFIVAVIGFWFSGVKYFLLLPTLIAIFAFIPGLGPAIVWVPTVIVLFLQENYFGAIGVIITGLIVSLFIDTIMRAKISEKSTKIHPVILLIGIVGGVTLFGMFGFIIGPLILSYTIKIIEEIAE